MYHAAVHALALYGSAVIVGSMFALLPFFLDRITPHN